MRPHLEDDPDLKTRFLAEARAATQLSHPHIARIFDFTVDQDGVAYLVMELIDGVSLEELLASGESVPIALTLEIARQSLRAIGHIHKHGVAHRDISPDNLMLGRDVDGRPLVKLIDLGIAKNLDGSIHDTGSGVFLGKFRYAAPETFDGGESDRRSGDLYSFGLVLYELLTGTFPISGDSPSSLIAGHLFRQPVGFAESDPEGRVPEGVRKAVLEALDKKPDRRFADAESFASALEPPEPLDLRSPEIERLLELTADEDWRKTRIHRPPGSTQRRLDRQFEAVATPAPGPIGLPGPAVDLDAETVQLRRSEVRPPPDSSASEAEPQLPVAVPATEAIRADDLMAQARGLAQAEEFVEARRLLSSAASAGDHPEVLALLSSVEACINVREQEEREAAAAADSEDATMVSQPAAADRSSELDKTLRTIRRLRDDGRAGAAFEALNRAVREYGSEPALRTLRHEIGEALLAREAEEESGSRMFESLRQTSASAGKPQAPPPRLSDATIRSVDAVRAPFPQRPAPPVSHSNRNLIAAGVVLALVFAALVFFLTREQPEAETAAPIGQPAAAVSPGSVVIDAVPWAEIVSLVDPEAEEDPPISPSGFTPVVLSLPPGEYRIVLRYPPTGQEEERVVRVESGVSVDLRLIFESYDAKRYFKQIGW